MMRMGLSVRGMQPLSIWIVDHRHNSELARPVDTSVFLGNFTKKIRFFQANFRNISILDITEVMMQVGLWNVSCVSLFTFKRFL